MISFEQMLSDKQIQEEYKKAFLLNMFKKIVVKQNKDTKYKDWIHELFRQSTNRLTTVKVIIKNEFNYELTDNDSNIMLSWFDANLRKMNRRKPIPQEVKEKLYNKQHGLCVSCGEPLGKDWSKIHVDHIIPWILVGDELEDNYQDLCDTCNECKSSKCRLALYM